MKKHTKKTISYFWGHLKRYPLRNLIIFAAVLIGESTVMLWPYYLAQFFDIAAAASDPQAVYPDMLRILGIIAAIGGAMWIAYRFIDFGLMNLVLKVRKNIVDESFDYLHGHSYRFFNNNFAGSLVKKLTRLARSFEAIYLKIVHDFAPTFVRLTIALVVMFFINKTLFLAVFIWTLLFLALNYGLSVYKVKFDLARSKAETRASGELADTIVNNFNIKVFANSAKENANFQEVTYDWHKKSHKSWSITAYIDSVQAIMMIGLEVAIIGLLLVLWRDGLVGIGAIFLVQTYILEIFEGLWDFGRNMREVYEKFADAEEMTVILNKEHEVADAPDAKELQVSGGKLEFKNVEFSYSAEGETVLQNFNLAIKPSEKVALVGPSGGGKSTIIKLILRLYNLNGGKIEIDGQDISKVTQESLRQDIALVPQEPILFHRTLRENIRYGNLEASDQAVEEAAKLAYCHEFIAKMPKGYETYVGERGVKLSGGQRQRVAIARAILSNAQLLILDEATSSLDSESELLIQKALTNLMKNKTVVMIAHRLSTIMQADRIFVLQDGKIVEEGTHAQLLAEEKSGTGLYKKLWDIQQG